MRREKIEIISCPTCGRTEVDLQAIADEIERRTEVLRDRISRHLRIAVMGCVVNGPGEAKGSDIGVACGKGKGVLFTGGQIVKTVKEEDIADEIVKMAEAYERDTGKFH